MRPLPLILAVLMAIYAPTAKAQDVSAQEGRKSRLEKEIAILDQQLETNSARTKSASAELTLVRKKMENVKALISESDREISMLNSRIGAKQREIALLQARLDTLRSYSSRLIISTYKHRDVRLWYMYILASDSIAQGFRRLGYLRNLSSQISIQAKKIKETEHDIQTETERLTAMREEARKLRENREHDLETLRQEEKRSDKLVSQLKREKTKYQKEAAAKRKEVEALNREIERIIRSAAEGGSRGSSKTEIDYALNAEFASNKGRLPWPADGPVVEPYGQRNHPVFTNVKLPFNNGITIALSHGTTVRAVFNGTVKQIAVIPGYNKCVLIQHGQYFSMYCKMGNVSVKAGDVVETGDIIGTVDTISGSTQLHFQIWDGTTPQNPSLWLKP